MRQVCSSPCCGEGAAVADVLLLEVDRLLVVAQRPGLYTGGCKHVDIYAQGCIKFTTT